MAVYLGLLGKGAGCWHGPGRGGHLTHGAKASFSGIFYQVMGYGLSRESGASTTPWPAARPGSSSPAHRLRGLLLSRVIDFAAFAEIAREVGAKLVADISHISGLCLTGQHPHPFPPADVVTTTTHKLLRGPRGGMILCKKELAAAIDKAVFPGLQGGPHNHTTAAIAVALKEAATPAYAAYCARVVEDARALAEGLLAEGFRLVTGGTDNHLGSSTPGPRGSPARPWPLAGGGGIVANANKIPFDPRSANDPSGGAHGHPGPDQPGHGVAEMDLIAGSSPRRRPTWKSPRPWPTSASWWPICASTSPPRARPGGVLILN